MHNLHNSVSYIYNVYWADQWLRRFLCELLVQEQENPTGWSDEGWSHSVDNRKKIIVDFQNR